MYTGFLHLHNALRLAIIISMVVVFVRALMAASGSSKIGAKAVLPAIITVDLQLLVGVALYALSPVVKGLDKEHYFAYLHPLLMILAIVGVHIVQARNKKSAGENPRMVAVGMGLVLVLTLLAIPWQRALLPGM